MSGIVSLLDKTHHTLVEEIWQGLETDCALTGINITSLPHFSWQVSEDYNFDALMAALQDIAVAVQPFTACTNGLGVFTAESPVAYVPVVRTKELSEFHEMIWDRLAPLSTNPNPYYSPSMWMPHITLAYGDVDAKTLNCLMEKLAFRPIFWEMKIDNLTLLYESDGDLRQTRYQLNFGQKEIG